MTGYTLEQEQRLAELARRKAEIDDRAANVLVEMRREMRERGEPVRGDFPSRAAYRAAVAKYRRKGTK